MKDVFRKMGGFITRPCKWGLIISISCWFSIQVLGAEISGVVTDAETGQILPRVNILIEGAQIGAFTDEQGRFYISAAPDYPFTLSAGHVGYKIEKVKITSPEITNLEIALQPVYLQGEEVLVTSSRASLANAPAAFSNLSPSQIRQDYHAQEMPLLLSSLPGVYAYSDAGNPQGYSYLKIRGFEQKRIAVMINGIPLNDPEDHQVYWVDMPDLAANIDDIQVQRGLGYSPYGPSAFGGSVNIITTPDPQTRRMELTAGGGSFDTRKVSALFNSGVVDNSYQIYGRFSRITTDGYRENSGFEGWSYFLSASRYGLKNTLTLNVYGGPEYLHAAWDGTYETILDTCRTYNPITYRHTVDNFNQPHYELHSTRELNKTLTFNNSLFYIKGLGYWQMYKEDRDLYEFGLSPVSLESDLVQQKWVAKHQTGWIPRLEFQGDKYQWCAGGNFNYFQSHHWDEIVWVELPPAGTLPNQSSNDYNGRRWEASLFGHILYKYSERLNLYGDLQYRHLETVFQQNPAGAFSGDELNRYQVSHDFLNPKAGLSYKLDQETTTYFSLGFASREPSDQEYWDAWQGPDDFGIDPLFSHPDTVRSNGTVKYVDWSHPKVEPETMTDIELGLRYRNPSFQAGLNFYWMMLRNEIIYGGGVYEGYPVMGNADRTSHKGGELEAAGTISEKWEISGNFSYSLNTFDSGDILGYDLSYNPVPVKGNAVPLFPDLMAQIKLAYNEDNLWNWKVKPILSFNYVGKQYLESTNMSDAVIDPYWLANFQLIAEAPTYPGFPDIKIRGVVQNLFEAEYETSGYFYDGNYYYPGPGQSYYLELTLGL